MKIIECKPEDYERMYCPSTDEVIFAQGQEIEEDAAALVAAWDSSLIDEPVINNEIFRKDWENFFENILDPKMSEGEFIWDDFKAFLNSYENPDWVVYECDFYGVACGPTCTTLVFVVKADTVIETDPDYREDELENE